MEFEKIINDATAEWTELSNRPVVYVGTSTCGCTSDASSLLKKIRDGIQEKGLNAEIIETGSFGFVNIEPMIIVSKPGKPKVCYGNVTNESAMKIIEGYLGKDDPMTDLAFCVVGEGKIKGINNFTEIPFFKGQVRTSLRNCGFISPDNINHYFANGGYNGLAKALKMAPDDVIKEAQKAGIKGRGGAGYPMK